MPQSLSRVLIHSVFSTKHREPYLRDTTLRAKVHQYLGGIINTLGCQSLIVGGVEDHVHLLSTLSRTLTMADLIKETKRVSTDWIQSQSTLHKTFRWQSGYGVFSIAHSQLDTVRSYIANQEQHHRTMSFQEEYRLLLQKYEVTFNETYLWD